MIEQSGVVSTVAPKTHRERSWPILAPLDNNGEPLHAYRHHHDRAPRHRRLPWAMVAPLYTTESGLLFHAGKILVLTVGLPARGKTHISRALERYLRWTGVKIMVVSLGDYRRKILGSAGKLPSDYFTLGKFDSVTFPLKVV